MEKIRQAHKRLRGHLLMFIFLKRSSCKTNYLTGIEPKPFYDSLIDSVIIFSVVSNDHRAMIWTREECHTNKVKNMKSGAR